MAAGSALGAAVVAGGVIWKRQRAPNRYYSGPVRENFDGTRFRLPGAPTPRGFGDLVRWQLSGERIPWPERDPSPYRDRPPRRVEGQDLRVVLVGHASFLIQTGGVNLLLDLDTLQALRGEHQPRFFVPLGNDTILQRRDRRMEVTALDWGESTSLGRVGGAQTAIGAHLVPSVHWSARSWHDRRHALWGSWVLETPSGLLYLVGDTGFGDGATFREVGRRFPGVRLALLPIGAYEPRWFMAGQHVNPDEAVRAFELVKAEVALGHHWGTFQLTDEAIHGPVRALEEARRVHDVPPERFPALRPGQLWEG